MKKIILNFAAVLFVLSCFFITSCKKELEKLSKTFSFEIVNAADVNLKINSIEFYHESMGIYNYYQLCDNESNIIDTVKIDKEIQKRSPTLTPESLKINSTIEYVNDEPNYIKINCSYQATSGATPYPYVGTLDGEKVSKMNYKTKDAYFYYKEGVTLNFVKTTNDDYVLCIVK